DAEAAAEHADRARAFSKAGVRFPARYRRPANLTGPSRSQRSMLRLVQEPRGIGSNHSAAAAWGHSIVRLVRRWCDRPIASKTKIILSVVAALAVTIGALTITGAGDDRSSTPTIATLPLLY